jgi:cytochrome c oxidase assembly factor CtaG
VPDMHAMLAPLSWQVFFSTWQWRGVWVFVVGALLVGYLSGFAALRRRDRAVIHPVRALSFVVGLGLLLVSVSSAIETYSHLLFWDHMVQHLLLVMVVPALLVVGHPLTLIVHAGPTRLRAGVARALRSGPVAVLTHPLVALAIYTAVIVGTHLTSFMNAMATHEGLHDAEEVLYLVGGYLFLLPLLGDEPIRWRAPHLMRMVVLFIAMAPDTVVGIVLLQAPRELFPALAEHRPSWAPSAVHDLNTGGGIMWAFGDGLMMLFIVAVMLAYLTNSSKHATAGNWLEGVRRRTLAGNLGRGAESPSELDDTTDMDDDEATLRAYNAMLKRMNQHDSA